MDKSRKKMVNDLADKYYYFIDEELDNALDWENFHTEDPEYDFETILRVKLEIYTAHAENIKKVLKELKT
jgi:hypothetical protein